MSDIRKELEKKISKNEHISDEYKLKNMIDNFIDNLKNIDKYNFTNTILYVNNNTTKCSHPSNKQEFYPLFLLFILWYIIFKCF